MTEIRDMFADQAKWFAGTSTTNYPTGAIRLNTTTHKLEKYNGSTWDVLDLTGLNVGSVVSKVPAAASGLATLDANSKLIQNSSIGLLNVRFLTTGTSYTPTTGTRSVIAWLVGGGGGGGGAVATGAGQQSVGGGGGGAGMAIYYGAVGAGPYTYAIGAGGTGGTVGSSYIGANGGDTTLMGITAVHGIGGSAGAIISTFPNYGAQPGVGGSVTGGANVILPGELGEQYVALGATVVTGLLPAGGSSFFGPGASRISMGNAGNNATVYGSGGGAGGVGASSSAQNGGNGAGGIIIIYEFS
jgi:hypothetical protein